MSSALLWCPHVSASQALTLSSFSPVSKSNPSTSLFIPPSNVIFFLQMQQWPSQPHIQINTSPPVDVFNTMFSASPPLGFFLCGSFCNGRGCCFLSPLLITSLILLESQHILPQLQSWTPVTQKKIFSGWLDLGEDFWNVLSQVSCYILIWKCVWIRLEICSFIFGEKFLPAPLRSLSCGPLHWDPPQYFHWLFLELRNLIWQYLTYTCRLITSQYQKKGSRREKLYTVLVV